MDLEVQKQKRERRVTAYSNAVLKMVREKPCSIEQIERALPLDEDEVQEILCKLIAHNKVTQKGDRFEAKCQKNLSQTAIT